MYTFFNDTFFKNEKSLPSLLSSHVVPFPWSSNSSVKRLLLEIMFSHTAKLSFISPRPLFTRVTEFSTGRSGFWVDS